MNCPECGNSTHVNETRKKKGGVWRRRECPECLTRFSTFENIIRTTVDKYSINKKEN